MTDNATGQALDGRVEVLAAESTYTAVPHAYKAVPTDPRLGDFHRILQPGIYSMTCRAEGYAPLTIENIVVAADATTEIDCSLVSIEGRQHRRPFGGPS